MGEPFVLCGCLRLLDNLGSDDGVVDRRNLVRHVGDQSMQVVGDALRHGYDAVSNWKQRFQQTEEPACA